MKNNILLCLSIVGITLCLPLSTVAQRSLIAPQATICQFHSAGVGLIPPGGQGKI
jgi:hypothetical protein